jgi:hypothetical protein
VATPKRANIIIILARLERSNSDGETVDRRWGAELLSRQRKHCTAEGAVFGSKPACVRTSLAPISEEVHEHLGNAHRKMQVLLCLGLKED